MDNLSNPDQNYLVLDYNEATLAEALSNKYNTVDSVHFETFSLYLGGSPTALHAKTIVIEQKYLSTSFLIDFAQYYSLCYNSYERFCKRIHFFTSPISQDEFENAVRTKQEDYQNLWDSYLGFITIKPLPKGLIGPTLIRNYYQDKKDNNFFPVTRNYEIFLFGKNLNIETLVFQEQDEVIASCASIALWISFSKISRLFQTKELSPSEITEAASNLYFETGRSFPTEGLSSYQVGTVIESLNLVSELRNRQDFFERENFFKSFIYAYCRFGVPVLLGFDIKSSTEEGFEQHLVSVVGYKQGAIEKTPTSYSERFKLKAEFIEKLYVHDDQIGPFVQLDFSNDGKAIQYCGLNGDIKNRKIIERLDSIFVPLDPRIRIKFEDVYKFTQKLHGYFIFQPDQIASNIYWDIFLQDQANYKNELVEQINQLKESLRQHVLFHPLPKYLWVARAYLEEQVVLELIFDATDIHTNSFCIMINIWNENLKHRIQNDYQDEHFQHIFFNLFELDKRTYERLGYAADAL